MITNYNNTVNMLYINKACNDLSSCCFGTSKYIIALICFNAPGISAVSKCNFIRLSNPGKLAATLAFWSLFVNDRSGYKFSVELLHCLLRHSLLYQMIVIRHNWYYTRWTPEILQNLSRLHRDDARDAVVLLPVNEVKRSLPV